MNSEEQKIESAAPEAEAKTERSKATKARPRKTKKAKTQITQGKAFIQATFNNTIVSLCDMNGNVLAWSSAGAVGFKGPKKSTPYAASIIVRDAVEKVKAHGLKEVSVYISGVGQGREGALRAFQSNNIDVLSIKDVTPVPHNGCRQPRPRRV